MSQLKPKSNYSGGKKAPYNSCASLRIFFVFGCCFHCVCLLFWPLGVGGPKGVRALRSLVLGPFQVDSYCYRSLIEGLYTL